MPCYLGHPAGCHDLVSTPVLVPHDGAPTGEMASDGREASDRGRDDIADDQLLVDHAVNFGLLIGCGQHNREATALRFLLVEAVAHREARPGQPHTTHSGDVCVVTHG